MHSINLDNIVWHLISWYMKSLKTLAWFWSFLKSFEMTQIPWNNFAEWLHLSNGCNSIYGSHGGTLSLEITSSGICTCQAVFTWPYTLLNLGSIAKLCLLWLCCLKFWKLSSSISLDCHQLDMCHILISCDCSWGRPELRCWETLRVYVTHTLEMRGWKINIALSVHHNESLLLLPVLISFPWKKN